MSALSISSPAPVSRIKAPTIRQASFDDYDEIARLESSVGLTPRPRGSWLHLWRNNPAYQAVEDWPIGWVLEDRDRHIVGSIGNIPFLYNFQGRTYLAATFVGWAVSPQYRSSSLLLVTHKFQHPKVDFQLVTTAGIMPQAVFTKLNWSRAPVGKWDEAAFWITSYGGAVEGYLKCKCPVQLPALLRSALSLPLRAIDVFPRRKPALDGDCELAWSTSFDPAFDTFWSELLETHTSHFLASRSRDALDWHFRYSLDQGNAWILTARQGDRMVGYAILQRKDSPSRGLTRMRLADFQILGSRPSLGSDMVAYALRRCRQEKIHILENLGSWLEELQPLSNPPSNHRTLDSWCYLYKPLNLELKKDLESAAHWYPTQYDGDASL